ncbi:MAG: hypothetical protein RQ842_02425 [Vulcanisaeta sp.]|nr:hypothetical protein [Vulcanisaeta sp.]
MEKRQIRKMPYLQPYPAYPPPLPPSRQSKPYYHKTCSRVKLWVAKLIACDD